MTRRDKCHLVGKRAPLLTPEQAAAAWALLADQIEDMGEMDVPKFNNLIASIRFATILGKQARPAHDLNNLPWRCFHCNEVFQGAEEARLHFGSTQYTTPICQMDATAVRDLEAQLARYREEDTDLHRQIHSMSCEHQQALRRAEEAGYEKGLRDGKAIKE